MAITKARAHLLGVFTDGALTGFQGQDPDELPVSLRGPAQVAGGVAVVMGDSIVENGSNDTNGQHNSRSVFSHANRRLGRPFDVAVEVGYGGKTTAEVFAHWDEVVTPNDPGTVVWSTGTNDFSAGLTPAEMVATLDVVHQRTIAEGRRFLYLGMPPLQSPVVAEFFARLRQFQRNTPTFEYTGGPESMLNFNGNAASLGAPTPLTNAMPDLTHPSAMGANLWGGVVAAYLERRGVNGGPVFSFVTNPGTGIGDNGHNLMVNGLVGSAGANWSAAATPAGSRTPTISQQAMGTAGLQSRVPGRLYRVVWAPGAGPAATDRMESVCVNDCAANASAYAGKTFRPSAYAKITAAGGLIHGAELIAVAYDWSYGATLATSKDNALFDVSSMATWSIASASYEGVFQAQDITLPSTWTGPEQAHFLGYLRVYAEPGATVTVDCGAMQMIEVFSD